MMELSCSTAKKLCLIDSTLQALFDDDELLFKWTNQTCFNDTANYLHDRPDGCTEDDDIKIGYLEVKPINKANDHKKISTNLHRLGLFFKATTTKHKLKHTIQVMVVGTNVQFHISEAKGNVLTMVELDTFRFPLSMDKLPQLLPYLHRLYNVVATIYRYCYNQTKLSGDMPSACSLEIRVINAHPVHNTLFQSLIPSNIISQKYITHGLSSVECQNISNKIQPNSTNQGQSTYELSVPSRSLNILFKYIGKVYRSVCITKSI